MKPSFINILLLLGAVAVVNTSQAVVVSGPVVNPANNHSYYLLGPATWTASQTQAIGLGGNLVTINDAAENTFVTSTFLNFGGIRRDLWIGLSDTVVEGTYKWADGTPFSYSNWEPGQPDNGDGAFPNEDWIHIYGGTTSEHVAGWTPGLWNDSRDVADYITNSGTQRFLSGVVEVVPEPSTCALVCVIASFCFWSRNRRSR